MNEACFLMVRFRMGTSSHAEKVVFERSAQGEEKCTGRGGEKEGKITGKTGHSPLLLSFPPCDHSFPDAS